MYSDNARIACARWVAPDILQKLFRCNWLAGVREQIVEKLVLHRSEHNCLSTYFDSQGFEAQFDGSKDDIFTALFSAAYSSSQNGTYTCWQDPDFERLD